MIGMNEELKVIEAAMAVLATDPNSKATIKVLRQAKYVAALAMTTSPSDKPLNDARHAVVTTLSDLVNLSQTFSLRFSELQQLAGIPCDMRRQGEHSPPRRLPIGLRHPSQCRSRTPCRLRRRPCGSSRRGVATALAPARAAPTRARTWSGPKTRAGGGHGL